MKIINPSSSMPALQDGLEVYSGISDLASTDAKTITIETRFRFTYFVRFYAVPGPTSLRYPFPSIPNYESQYVELGYLQEVISSSNSNLKFSVKCPSGYRLHYFIVGNTFIRDNIHSEITSSAVAVEPAITELLLSIPSALNGATFLINSTSLLPANFSYNNSTPGELIITASSPIFSLTKTTVFAQVESTALDATPVIALVKVLTTAQIKLHYIDPLTMALTAPISKTNLRITNFV